MILRKANKQDVPVLKRWDENQHVIDAGGEDAGSFNWEKEIPRNVDWREILIAEENDVSIGVIIVIDPKREETHYWGKTEPNLRALDIWIGEAGNLGKGYGTEMMKLALDRCFTEPGVQTVLIDPLETNTKAQRFYERLGFRFVERRRFGRDDCFVYRMDRNNWISEK